ncbi:Por secretion system C-terminal sorting domain-containing protein [Lishizhenia tianjinensis]|uniref:Por secretion system C-terminal sorting domain-containing protein n=1 Tax=Lishizhenia tianjinensis TaxID=477690 RepID=A0A1I6XFQ2_9FLAO|nr:T9SS type A sorting domain-containing protein [Lishizhenia tianjinensis]SFT37198.1 Por secretion system C-terminal sorting domain-containing protein [Lishizhenia tianjinensis]
MNKLLLLVSLFLTSSISAQMNSFVQLDENAIQCIVNSNGELFTDLFNVESGFNVENSQNLHTIFSNRIVFAGLGPNGDLVMTKPNGSNNLANGPLSVLQGMEFGPATITPSQSNAWSQIFVITRSEISEFYQYNACLNDPNCDEQTNFPGYQIPPSILNWPAHGDTTLNEPYNLAAFNDVNDDNVYNPLDGDYPCIKGKVYAWFIMNNYLVDPSVNTAPGGIEIQVEVYQFEEGPNNPPLLNTVFVGYKVINRSTTPLADFYFSNYTDFDLGNPLDDYIGTLPDHNGYFVYNGDDFDETSSFSTGFQNHLPAQGVFCLNHELSGAGFADIDVLTPIEYYNIMRGYHTDGSVKYFPGTQIATAFTFPYTSNTPYQWSESNSDGNGMVNTPGDRRMQGAVGPFMLDVGEQLSYDFAFVYAKDHLAGQGNLGSIDELIEDIEDVQYYYDNQITNCSGGWLATEEIDEFICKVFPNPATDLVYIEISNRASDVFFLRDVQGRIVRTGDINIATTIDVRDLTSGVYYLNLQGHPMQTYKIVKQ